MSMTGEEAIKHLLHDWHINLGCDFAIKPGRLDDFLAALDVALSALRPITRERVEMVLKAEWVRHKKDDDFSSYYTCSKCGAKFGESCGIAFFERDFCPMCGSPVTDSGVDMIMERLEALKDG